MELELAERASRHARQLISLVDSGQLRPIDAARVYRKRVLGDLKKLGGKDDYHSKQYYNYALIKGLSDAIDHYRSQKLIEGYLNLFGTSPASAETHVLASAIARVHLDPRLRQTLRNLARRHERVLRFLSHAAVIDPASLESLARAIDNINRHGSPDEIPDDNVHNAVSRILEDFDAGITTHNLLVHEWGKLSDNVEGLAANYQRILAILDAERSLRSEMPRRVLSENLQRMLGELGEDGASTFLGTVIKHFNKAIYSLEEKIYHNHGPVHVYYNRVEPARLAYKAALAAISGAYRDIEDASDDLDAYRRAFNERAHLPDDHEHAPLLDAALYGFMASYGYQGARIYGELARIHGKDPLGVLGDEYENRLPRARNPHR